MAEASASYKQVDKNVELQIGSDNFNNSSAPASIEGSDTFEDPCEESLPNPVSKSVEYEEFKDRPTWERRRSQRGSFHGFDEKMEASIESYTTKSILVTIFCFFPLGIVAVVLSRRVQNYVKHKELYKAKKLSKTVRSLCIAALVIGMIIYVLSLVLGIIFVYRREAELYGD